MGSVLSKLKREYKEMIAEDSSEKNEFSDHSVTFKQIMRPLVIAFASSFIWTEVGKIISLRISPHFEDQTPDRIRCYVLATIHAFYSTCYAINSMIKSYNKGDLDSTGHMQFISLSLGYFISDTLNIWNKGYPLTLFHHFLGMICEIVLIFVPSARKLFPFSAVVEITTFILCLSWFSKELLSSKHPLSRNLSKAFGISYLLVRCIYFPVYIYWAKISSKTKDSFERLGKILNYALVLLIGLQFYWAIGIVKLLIKNTTPPKKLITKR